MAYKDSLFRSLFGNEKAALDLYNALHGTDYSEQDTKIAINTLGESVFTPQKNDLSFLINGRQVVMVEHQSTINENMSLRFLQPIARIFENSIPDKKALYRKAMIRLPRPEFIVLYNGTAPFPAQETLRLSDAYERIEGFDEINLELEVKVYNINEGSNAETVNRCEALRGYAYFVHQVRHHETDERRKKVLPETDILRTAIRNAIQDCKTKNLLVDFWNNLTQEEVNMLGTEWDFNTALEVEREEAFEIVARNALTEGVSIEFISKITGLDIEKVRELSYSRRQAQFKTALEVEREEGIEKGIEIGREKTARNALTEGIPIELVSKITKLDIEKVREISYSIGSAE